MKLTSINYLKEKIFNVCWVWTHGLKKQHPEEVWAQCVGQAAAHELGLTTFLCVTLAMCLPISKP